MRVAVVIPTYNEKENISLLLAELLERFKKLPKYKFDVLVVDDTSPDGTGEIVRGLSQRYKNIHLLSGKKEGLGKAMVRGYKYALKNLKPDVVITNEADFGFSFSHLPKMLEKISDGYDVVVASRHVGEGKSEGWTLTRKLNHFIANTFFAETIAGIRQTHDKNGAMRVVRVKGVLDRINWKSFPASGFGFFFYQIYALSLVTDKFCEIPSTFKFRTRGESKVSFNPKYFKSYLKDILEYIKLAFQIRKERSKIK